MYLVSVQAHYQELLMKERVLEGIMAKHREIDALQSRLNYLLTLRAQIEAEMAAVSSSEALV